MPAASNILFMDIETVPVYSCFGEVPDQWKFLWGKKADSLIKDREKDNAETIYNRAGMYAEFGKIICISCGVINGTGEDRKLTLKSFYGDDEAELLKGFCELLNKWAGRDKVLCAHNGKEFDFPFLVRRIIINRLPIPVLLQLSGKKPWEIPHFDTLDMWRFGDYKSYISLNLLACTLDVPTPKDDIDGSMVWRVYWEEKDLERIVTYCQKDVITVAQVYLRLAGETLIKPESIEIKR
ncbi:MAG: 3'-5' exonuclease [Chitinophagaceae bacterium]|nr:3'-5' exonuclease [Chitinophagaceae bacterium]